MSFPIPVFPLVGNIWTSPNDPAAGPADVTLVPFALYASPHLFAAYYPSVTSAPFPPGLNLTVLIKTPVALYVYNRGDIIEPNGGSGEYYEVLWKEHFYLGFPQVFDGLGCWQCNANRTTPRTY